MPVTNRTPSTGSLRLIAATSVAVVSAVVLGACGGSDEPPARPTTTTVDAAAWRTDLDDECSALNEEYAHLAESDPADADEAVAYAEDVEQFAAALVVVVRDAAARADGDDRDAVDALVEAATDLESATTQLAAAARDGDAEAVDTAATEVDEVGPRINAAAEDLGVDACGGF